MQELKILKVNNGYELSWYEDEVDKNGEKYKQRNVDVVEDINDNENDTMERMLEFIAIHFGKNYDKWSEDNLNITFDKKGHKLE